MVAAALGVEQIGVDGPQVALHPSPQAKRVVGLVGVARRDQFLYGGRVLHVPGLGYLGPPRSRTVRPAPPGGFGRRRPEGREPGEGQVGAGRADRQGAVEGGGRLVGDASGHPAARTGLGLGLGDHIRRLFGPEGGQHPVGIAQLQGGAAAPVVEPGGRAFRA